MSAGFAILGNLEARLDGCLLDVGHSRQRHVLAVLLIDANRPVSVGQLAERVWGQDHPCRARESIYSYLSRLRKAFTPARDVGLSRQTGGYLLKVDPLAVDLNQFEMLVEQAHHAGDERAEPLLTRALALWRGEALSGMDTPWFNTVRAALDRKRIEAELSRNDAVLRLGGHSALLPELYSQAERHPLDERLAAQLMLALYRTGRAAAALEHYQQVRRNLIDELGTEPGNALCDLQKRILACDPALSQVKTASSPVPRQLPASSRLFAGRAGELDRLSAALGRGARPGTTAAISLIKGPGGFGKTALVLHWARENISLFPDGQLYLNLHGFDQESPPMPTAVALRILLAALGVPPDTVPADIEAQTGLYRSAIAGRRILVILDDAFDTAQVTPLLPGDPRCAVLVTSRQDLGALVTSCGALSLTLDVLDDAAARQLLIGQVGRERADGAPEACRQLLDLCSGLPLALNIIGMRDASHPDFPLSVLASELHDEATRLDALDAGESAASLRAVFGRSCEALTAEARSLFALLGLMPTADISVAAAASLAGQPVRRTRRLLQSLEQAHLLRQDEPGLYRMHDLIRLYARERAGQDHSEKTRSAALSRLSADQPAAAAAR